MDELALSVAGTLYKGWENVVVTRSIEQMASTFSVGFAELWNVDGEPIPINEGDAVIVKAANEELITGYVDDSNISYGVTTHTMSVTGRSLTGDLVDCAAIYKTGQWLKSKIDTIAKNLCKPFSVDVITTGDMGAKFKKISIQDGESVHELLGRLAKMRALMLIDTPKGELHLTRVGARKVSTVLERGVNILTGSKRGSMRDRYSEYTIKAQISGDDTTNGKDATIKRSISDERVRRYRPTILTADTEDTGKELEDSVKWERNRRAGGARRVSYTALGWRDDDEMLWEPNTLVDVTDKLLRVSGELLIVSVKYQRSSAGTTTLLELARKEAFDLIDLPPPKGDDDNMYA